MIWDGKQLLCRLCLKTCEFLIHIFTENDKRGVLVWEVMREHIRLDVSEDDGLPGTICRACMKKLNAITDFKVSCIKSTELLLEVLSWKTEPDVKFEPSASEDCYDGSPGYFGSTVEGLSALSESFDSAFVSREGIFDMAIDISEHGNVSNSTPFNHCCNLNLKMEVEGNLGTTSYDLQNYGIKDEAAVAEDLKVETAMEEVEVSEETSYQEEGAYEYDFEKVPLKLEPSDSSSNLSFQEEASTSAAANNVEDDTTADVCLNIPLAEEGRYLRKRSSRMGLVVSSLYGQVNGMPMCHICDRPFETKRGLSVHLARQHCLSTSSKRVKKKPSNTLGTSMELTVTSDAVECTALSEVSVSERENENEPLKTQDRMRRRSGCHLKTTPKESRNSSESQDENSQNEEEPAVMEGEPSAETAILEPSNKSCAEADSGSSVRRIVRKRRVTEVISNNMVVEPPTRMFTRRMASCQGSLMHKALSVDCLVSKLDSMDGYSSDTGGIYGRGRRNLWNGSRKRSTRCSVKRDTSRMITRTSK